MVTERSEWCCGTWNQAKKKTEGAAQGCFVVCCSDIVILAVSQLQDQRRMQTKLQANELSNVHSQVTDDEQPL